MKYPHITDETLRKLIDGLEGVDNGLFPMPTVVYLLDALNDALKDVEKLKGEVSVWKTMYEGEMQEDE